MRLNRKLICALALVSVGSTIGTANTLAKYTSEVQTVPETARLAKYSFGQTGTLDLFAARYVDATDGNKPGDTNVTVKATNGADKVIAPGTTNTANLVFTSNSEVKTSTDVILKTVKIENDIEGVLSSYITLKNVTINGTLKTSATLAEIQTALTNGQSVKLVSGQVTDAAATGTITVPIQWVYEFSSDDDQDAKDTAAAIQTTLPTITLTFTGINTQID